MLFFSNSLTCKSTVIPLAVTFDAIQPINPNYRTRIVVSMKGFKGSQKNAIDPELVRAFIFPCI